MFIPATRIPCCLVPWTIIIKVSSPELLYLEASLPRFDPLSHPLLLFLELLLTHQTLRHGLLYYVIHYTLDPQTLIFKVLTQGGLSPELSSTSSYAQALLLDQAHISLSLIPPALMPQVWSLELVNPKLISHNPWSSDLSSPNSNPPKPCFLESDVLCLCRTLIPRAPILKLLSP